MSKVTLHLEISSDLRQDLLPIPHLGIIAHGKNYMEREHHDNKWALIAYTKELCKMSDKPIYDSRVDKLS